MEIVKVKEEHDNLRVDVFLMQELENIPSRSFAKKLIDHGHVRVNEKNIKSNYRLSNGEDVLITIPDDFLTPQYVEPERIKLNIFYEDESLIVLNKPKGLLVHPTNNCFKGTLVNALLHYSKNLSNINSEMRPGIVHRLDKETSGLMLIAKDNITHTKLAKQFKQHRVKKKYVALVQGDVEFDEGVINAPMVRHPKYREKKAVRFTDEAKEAQTVYKVRKRHDGVSLVNLYPKTGRTHQLRVHMAYLKHPILGDDKYGKKISFSRLALHAQGIGFKHPRSKQWVEFYTTVPEEFLQKVDL